MTDEQFRKAKLEKDCIENISSRQHQLKRSYELLKINSLPKEEIERIFSEYSELLTNVQKLHEYNFSKI